jgi:hypothetical protein
MCFQCTIPMWKMDELWMNEFCMISITKLWDVKFVINHTKFWSTISMQVVDVHNKLWFLKTWRNLPFLWLPILHLGIIELYI